MKVTQEMLHPELQPHYWKFRLITLLIQQPWALKLVGFLQRKLTSQQDIDGVECSQRCITGTDGLTQIRVRIYRPRGALDKLPIMVYFHGGGYLIGAPELSSEIIEGFIKTRPCVVVAPDYRKSLQHPYPAAFDDCYDTLLWAKENAAELGGAADKMMLAGHSAGGGLTAAVTLKARDTRDVEVAFQLPFYPMIDDQQPYDSDREIDSLVWNTRMNRFAWKTYLGEGKDVSPYAAPARNTDYTKFPPTATFIGDMDPFHQETLEYVDALRKQGTEVVFKEYPGCFHSFEWMTDEPVSKDGKEFTFSVYSDFYDRLLN